MTVKLEDLEFEQHQCITGAEQAIIRFDNDYGASVVRGGMDVVYTDAGTYELAVIKYEGEEWELVYDTPVTDGVLGYLSKAELLRYLLMIERLPQHVEESNDEGA